MKKIFTLFLTVYALAAIGQPTINSGWFPTIGTSLSMEMFDATNVNEGPAGANQNWVFSVTPNGTTATNTFVSPASTPFASTFPNANLTITGLSMGGSPFYSYYNHTSASTELLGIAWNDAGTGVTVEFPYSNPHTQIIYPSTYNTSFTDNFSGSYTIVLSGITVNNSRTGTMTSVVDGYGTLTTPAGTVNNVLRFKFVQATTDVSSYVGVPLPPVTTTSNITTYSWISPSINHYGLFQLSYDTTANDQGGPPTYGKSGMFQQNFVGVNEITLKENVHAYPNPAKDFTRVDVSKLESGDAELIVVDAMGKIVKQQEIPIGGGNSKYVYLHLEEFSNGLYQMRITQKDKMLTSKFIKQ